MFDVLFNKTGEGDSAMHDALERYRDRVVVSANIDVGETHQIIVPNETLIPPPPLADDRVGFVNFWSDSVDGIVRNYITSDRNGPGQQSLIPTTKFCISSRRAP